MDAKDRYYNYGPQHLWIDAETYGCTYKVIHDKAGTYLEDALHLGRGLPE